MFVPLTLPGERVRARLGSETAEGISAQLVELVASSPQRRSAPCAHFSNPDLCGGCTLQQLDPSAYAEWKREQVRTALRRHGVDDSRVEPVQTAEPGTRRRAVFTARKRDGRVVLGFNERHTHRIIDLQTCLVLEPAIAALLPDLRRALVPALAEGAAAEVAVALLDGGLDVLVTADEAPALAAREALGSFAEAQDIARLSWRTRNESWIEPLAHRRPVAALFGGVPTAVAPGSFLQATASGEQALVREVLDGVGVAPRVVDLFAGAGTFSFPLAAAAGRKVHAVEGDSGAVTALLTAARQSRLAITGERRDLFRDPLRPAELARYDAAVFDPPRAGARAQAEMLAGSDVHTVVAVSCNAATFARDARLLVDGGFELQRVAPVDQFLWSAHIEVVGTFRRWTAAARKTETIVTTRPGA